MEQGKKMRRRFDAQFKVDAVRLARESGKSLAAVARELGIARSLLERWKKRLENGKWAATAFPGNGNLSPENKELEELRRELARVKEEREILKKAMAVFSRRP